MAENNLTVFLTAAVLAPYPEKCAFLLLRFLIHPITP
jgi:hypothetical protein